MLEGRLAQPLLSQLQAAPDKRGPPRTASIAPQCSQTLTSSWGGQRGRGGAPYRPDGRGPEEKVLGMGPTLPGLRHLHSLQKGAGEAASITMSGQFSLLSKAALHD